MKKTAFLINTSRGPIVNEDDLIIALSTNVILGAGIDVYEKEPLPEGNKLRFLPNALLHLISVMLLQKIIVFFILK